MRIDVMVDIETLGTSSDSTIFQISSVAFDINTGDTISSYNRIADIRKNEDYEMNVSGNTLVWWLNTDKDLLSKLLNEGKGSSSELIEDFNTWLVGLGLVGDLHLWGNGIIFDNKMIQHQFENSGLEYPIHYKRDRDVRTIVDLTCVKLGITEKELRDKYYDKNLEVHNAFNDVINQINLVVNCYRELTSVE